LQDVFPDQGFYVLSGSLNQPSLVVFQVSSPVQSVLLDDHQNLPFLNSTSLLSPSITQGWFYNGQTGMLFVKFESNISDSIRVIENSQNSSSSNHDLVYVEYSLFIALFGESIAGLFYLRNSITKRISKRK